MRQLAEARNRFSQVFAPRGEEAMPISRAEHDVAAGRRRLSFGEFLAAGPSFAGVAFERRPSPPRNVDFGAEE